MRLTVSAETTLGEPNVDCGFITWFVVSVIDGYEGDERIIGTARAALIHVALAEGQVWDALDADSGELEALYDVYFKDGSVRDEFCEGVGSELLYIAEIEMDDEHRDRNVDFALVKRLTDTIGQGSILTVMPYESFAEAARWAIIGFESSTPAKSEGFMAINLAFVQPNVVETDDDGVFEVVGEPGGKRKKLLN